MASKVKALPAPAGSKKSRANGKGGALVSLFNRLAADAKVAAEKEPTGGRMSIRTDKKKFTYGDTVLPNPLKVVVLAQSHYNAYYDTPYNPDDPQPPACFAVSDEAGSLVRHEKAPRSPVGEGTPCSTCPMNAFGSADVGRGKACNNYRRLSVVMADDPALRADGDLTDATLQVSPTGLGAWSKYVKGLAKIENLPPHGVISHFSFDPERNTPTVVPVSYDRIDDESVLEKVLAKRQQVIEEGSLLSIPDTTPRAPKEKVAAGGKRGANVKGKAGGRAAVAGTRRF